MSTTPKAQKFPFNTESARYRDILLPYFKGPGIELASQGDPICDTSWNLDLPPAQYAQYNSGHAPYGPIQLFGDAFQKFVEDGSLGYVFSSHLLEDQPYERWKDIFTLWTKALRKGGVLVVLVPDRTRWKAALDGGQPPNDAHRYEPSEGDCSKIGEQVGLVTIRDALTNLNEKDYSILYIGKKA